MKWQFERFLANTAINNVSIAKYKNRKGEIKIIAEKNGNQLGKYGQRYSKKFESGDEFTNWLESSFNNESLFYNRSQLVCDVLKALGVPQFTS